MNKKVREAFLDWYFGGSDQEREDTLLGLGLWVEEAIRENSIARIDIDDLIEQSNIELFEEDTNLKLN